MLGSQNTMSLPRCQKTFTAAIIATLLCAGTPMIGCDRGTSADGGDAGDAFSTGGDTTACGDCDVCDGCGETLDADGGGVPDTGWIGAAEYDLPVNCKEPFDRTGDAWVYNPDDFETLLGISHYALLNDNDEILLEVPSHNGIAGQDLLILSTKNNTIIKVPNCLNSPEINKPIICNSNIFYLNYLKGESVIRLFWFDLSTGLTYIVAGNSDRSIWDAVCSKNGLMYFGGKDYNDAKGYSHVVQEPFYHVLGTKVEKSFNFPANISCDDQTKFCRDIYISYPLLSGDYLVYLSADAINKSNTCITTYNIRNAETVNWYCTKDYFPGNVNDGIFVYEDYSNTSHFGTPEADIYMIDIPGKTIEPITYDAGSQTCALVHGKLVIYNDHTEFGVVNSGMANLYVYDIQTKTRRKVPTTPKAGCTGSFNGRFAIFSEGFSPTGTTMHLYNLEKMGVVKDGHVVPEDGDGGS